MYSKCDLILVGIFFTIGVGAQGFMSSSLLVNAMDLCPNYAGTVTGAMGSFGCFMGVLVPLVISFLTPNVSLRLFYLLDKIISENFITISVVTIGVETRVFYQCIRSHKSNRYLHYLGIGESTTVE